MGTCVVTNSVRVRDTQRGLLEQHTHISAPAFAGDKQTTSELISYRGAESPAPRPLYYFRI